eukprot:6202488-Pleurochrysis_carterae.AAC.1
MSQGKIFVQRLGRGGGSKTNLPEAYARQSCTPASMPVMCTSGRVPIACACSHTGAGSFRMRLASISSAQGSFLEKRVNAVICVRSGAETCQSSSFMGPSPTIANRHVSTAPSGFN